MLFLWWIPGISHIFVYNHGVNLRNAMQSLCSIHLTGENNEDLWSLYLSINLHRHLKKINYNGTSTFNNVADNLMMEHFNLTVELLQYNITWVDPWIRDLLGLLVEFQLYLFSILFSVCFTSCSSWARETKEVFSKLSIMYKLNIVLEDVFWIF